jgi:hypothetical protein
MLIVGGDWNCTYSTLPPASNPDICNMANLPNRTHSLLVTELCNDLDLCDPFRVQFPFLRDYTYIPREVNRANRSRLDFFLISKSLATKNFDCRIAHGTQNKLFDHKAIFLNLEPKKLKRPYRPTISAGILQDPDIDLVVSISVAECYLTYCNLPPEEKANLLETIVEARSRIRQAGPHSSILPPR